MPFEALIAVHILAGLTAGMSLGASSLAHQGSVVFFGESGPKRTETPGWEPV